ncbi:hypothetical protein PAMC26510_17690 [Caballeronia sordidicola]|uniref:Uncharacterized protein n=1 Tax=Caballeronia sordidicola TaxID=196367 RepID=A0A242MRP8_CABSO|nr:hypothetical protein PAMC26510_17690 [Caballeronia sordidicola]
MGMFDKIQWRELDMVPGGARGPTVPESGCHSMPVGRFR